MVYLPVPSVTPDRTFSMRTGLEASTVAPGSTAPDVSLTRPASVACANAANGTLTTIASAKQNQLQSTHAQPSCRLADP